MYRPLHETIWLNKLTLDDPVHCKCNLLTLSESERNTWGHLQKALGEALTAYLSLGKQWNWPLFQYGNTKEDGTPEADTVHLVIPKIVYIHLEYLLKQAHFVLNTENPKEGSLQSGLAEAIGRGAEVGKQWH
jgi:hypothetical protein